MLQNDLVGALAEDHLNDVMCASVTSLQSSLF